MSASIRRHDVTWVAVRRWGVSWCIAGAVLVAGCGTDSPPSYELAHPKESSRVALTPREVSDAGTQSVVVDATPRTRLDGPIRLIGTATIGPERGAGKAAGSAQSVAVVPVPRALAAHFAPGAHVSVDTAQSAAPPFDARVADIRELALDSVRTLVAVVHARTRVRSNPLVITIPRSALGGPTSRDSVVLVPEDALMRDAFRAFVFVQLDSSNFVQRRLLIEASAVSVPSRGGGGFAIAWEGVSPGERVVVRGVDKLLAAFSRAVLLDEETHVRPPR